MLEQALECLAVSSDGRYVDATFGRGGHSEAILARLGPTGRLLALDRDPDAIAWARAQYRTEPRFDCEQRPFSALRECLQRRGWLGRVDGVLLDLGVSSPQLDTPERGFSFTREGPLDMRMDPSAGISAAEWLAQVPEAGLRRVLREYGEERFAGRIAHAIVRERGLRPLTSTAQLAALVAAAVPTREPGKHPATRSFQAIRLQVNQELTELAQVLAQMEAVLAVAGRLVVISFHSLEDRMVKRFIRQGQRPSALPKDLPVRAHELRPWLRALGGPVYPDAEELERNPRARSAVLRAAERLAQV